MIKWDLKKIFSFFPIGLLLIVLILLNSHQTFLTYTVTKETKPLTMTFPGVVQPLQMVKVTSPIDGSIDSINVRPGGDVKKDQLLFTLTSPQLQTSLRSTINNYLRAKSSLDNTTFDFNGNTALYKAGLIAKNEYLSSQDAFETAKLTLWDATEQLKTLFDGVGLNEKAAESLTLKDIDKIKALIASAQKIKITSPVEGILSTQNGVSSASGDDKGLSVGTAVKQGDVIGMVYEMKGLNFSVKIVETQISQISTKQKATITGVAFPGITLLGYVDSVNQEANNDSLSNPTFTIRIIVPKITAAERALIKEGMSAIITLIKERPPAIRIPIAALIRTDTGYAVKRFNPTNGSVEEVPVETGDTDETSIAITNGLIEGEQIVVPD